MVSTVHGNAIHIWAVSALSLLKQEGPKHFLTCAKSLQVQTCKQSSPKLKMMIGLPATITFHSFRRTASIRLRNQARDFRELWSDALLGHKASHKSQGATTYLSGITTESLKRVVEALSYPTLCYG